jgi:hypothetical protein
VNSLRGVMDGKSVQYNGAELRHTWGQAKVPIYIAAHGPKTVEVAGQLADGAIVATRVGPEIRSGYLVDSERPHRLTAWENPNRLCVKGYGLASFPVEGVFRARVDLSVEKVRSRSIWPIVMRSSAARKNPC